MRRLIVLLIERKFISNIFQAKMSNIFWFQLVKCEDLMHFFVIYDSKWRLPKVNNSNFNNRILNIFGFLKRGPRTKKKKKKKKPWLSAKIGARENKLYCHRPHNGIWHDDCWWFHTLKYVWIRKDPLSSRSDSSCFWVV